ncbi:tripartite tricarboxylate transporter substrate binding protein [Variovorax sp. NFACC27]|uniref:Bug family tripartite tricarboxylate transporter substrate binding protein n=1 Tax=unclassified Variovorax TaxID=663243 RepID=UPI0008983B97|nr:tripartite tricarboxylate transporter substrate binding protein [Variovorax sp. YR750]MDP9606218.1 tripartite-type tricarboxylate transporter receptor subunit TctC [Variovorax paradoxus]SEF34674.1 Tripartite-type tricarboxylate transporter, receptor component TctC [Variovorax sp. NFACC28]SEG97683.1 Tripartite-type tricarboxylate transporter, receptor component TctC [Variovorax sp. NFACC29]SFD99586.1 Tripartite-type tricarboxylate transporter, receptor component TctC [Variovorax sp. NFACC26]
MQRRDFVRTATLFPLAGSGLLRAQPDWPQRPVKFILSQPAGSGPDILARYVADRLARSWAQPIVIENKPGGQNVIGALAAARSQPDGYTFYYATTAAMVTNAYTFKALPYDPAKDFAPVRLVGRSPFVIAAAANFPARNLKEALALAKAQPGSVAIATEGPKTFSGMLADSVAGMAGVRFNHVPYTKAPDALQDVIGGRVPLVCLPDAALTAYLSAGKVRALAVSTAGRQPGMPDVPALSETFPGFEYTGWNGLFAPAGTPTEVIARVNRDLEAVMQQPEVLQRLQTLGSQAEQRMSVPEFEAFMHSERERWAKLVRQLDIRPE